MQILPQAASTVAASVDSVEMLVFWVCLISFAIVMAMVIGFPLLYSRKSDNDITPDIRGNHVAEAIWTIIPTILCMVIFAAGLAVYNDMRAIPEDAMEVKITGRKWQWIFTYPDGRVVPNELVVPAGKDIRLVMKSDDVIHSFFVPDFRIKQDVLPNAYTKLWFNAPQPGEHQVFCTEYCGTSHSAMLAQVKVLSQTDYDAWAAATDSGDSNLPPEQLGQQAFSKYGCNACHSIDGSPLVGPSMKGLFGKLETLEGGSQVSVDENYLMESIYDPTLKVVQGFGPIMPSFRGMASEAEVQGLIAYIKSLK